MAISSKAALGASMQFTTESLDGVGALKGKNCTISAVDEIEGGHRVTFLWTADSGTQYTTYMDVMDGAQGEQGEPGEQGEDGRGIKNSYVDENSHFIIVYEDDTEEDCGEVTVISLQKDILPEPGESVVGKIYQYIGETTETLTNGYFYQCVSDGEETPTYSWVEKLVQSGGSGDSTLTADVTSNLAVGAIASGTTLPEGTTFTEFAQKLLITEIAPTINFSISKSGNVAYGGSYTETLTVSCSAMGSAKKIKKIEWYQNNTLLHTDNVDSSTTGSWTYTMDTATTDTTTFKAVVTYKKSNDTQTTATKTASINFYYNKFYGAVADLNPDEATVEALTSALATAKGGTYSFTVNDGRICYAYPKSLGALSSIKDGNGFSLFDSFTRTEQSYTQNGTTVAYYRYVLTDATTVSGYSVVFS